MKYYQSKRISGISFEEAKEKVIAALQTEGFGVLTEIDIQATMKKKLDKDYLPHTILGACNPVFADKVLQIEPTISTMLPCNVTLRKLDNNDIEVATIDPSSAMTAVGNDAILPIASEVQQKLKNVLDAL
ncbi:MAG: DUF302 domain-containing protein [Candidatus Competibacteraceae bacterium]|nr:DUF302 domain-containing protein [Candidatus Competibacteraceae bacterium]